MVDRQREPEETPGAALARMLEGQRMFMENIYALLRFLEAELTKHGWELIRNGGYAVTRNGAGRGLASFATADWVTDEIGIAFVQAGLATTVQGYTNTTISPEEGLDLLLFQVRWLDRSPAEPVVWHARLHCEPEGDKEPHKWEEYQSQVFARLEPEAGAEDGGPGEIHPGRATIRGAAITFGGHYSAVPVTALQTQEDVVMQLLQPALTGEDG